MSDDRNIPSYAARRIVVLVAVTLVGALLLWRDVYLQVYRKDFLQYQGDERYLRVVSVPAHRGMITDRNGEPLAISTPVSSVWANPQELALHRKYLPRLAKVLDLDVDSLQRLLASRGDREFVYLKRQVNPDVARRVMSIGAPGVALRREYRRYYPTGEVTAHVIGFTNVDDQGQEGVELAYNKWLTGTPGSKRVIKDRLGRIVEDVESIRTAQPGKNLALSIDRRLQYLAYRELKAAVLEHRARSGSIVILNVRTGEVLAMVNQPSFNPNNRTQLKSRLYRNRAVTDVFEPGSTVKPFVIAAALETGRYTPHTPIDTRPGTLRIGHATIRDTEDHGLIDVSHVIIESSNIGAAKISLSMNPQRLWKMYRSVGFGSVTGSGFPGEAPGLLTYYGRWHEIERATLAFGYGVSVTPLQLAQAYAILASGGVRRPISFVRVDDAPAGRRILPRRIVKEIIPMLEHVVSKEGTAQRAAVPGYQVAGKTGTVHKAELGGYAPNRYLSVFAGMAPASDPRLVMVVMINQPSDGEYYGGQVAAPVFSRVMAGALRILDIAPDDLSLTQASAKPLGSHS
jgi:cell division protein FtsI (penicillin-binding protein 3)